MMMLVYGLVLALAFSVAWHSDWTKPEPVTVKLPSWQFVLVWSIVMLTVVTVLSS